MKLSKKEIEFLMHSNYIEGEYNLGSLKESEKAWKFAVKKSKKMSMEYILKIHKKLMSKLKPDIAGKVRDCAVRVGGTKIPVYYDEKTGRFLYNFSGGSKMPKPEDGELETKLDDWIENNYQTSKTKEDVIKSHISFEHIHPFKDGNGRVGRILMNVQMINLDHPLLIIHEGEEQYEYYKWFK